MIGGEEHHAKVIWTKKGNPNVLTPIFSPCINFIYYTYKGGFVVLYVWAFLIAIFMFAVVYDQIRKCLWNYILKYVFK